MKKTICASLLILTLCGTQNSISKATDIESQNKQINTAINNPKTDSYFNKNNLISSNNVDISLQLIDAGKEPKQQLFFTPTVNITQTVIMTMEMNISLSINGLKIPAQENPKIKTEMELKVTKIDKNNDIHADFTYKNIEVIPNPNTPPEIINEMKTEISKMKGFKGDFVMDKYGNTKEANFQLPDSINPEMKETTQQMLDSLKQLSSPLPSEALGVGAKWQTTQSLTANGITLNQVINYEIVNINGRNITLKISLNQNANPQVIKSPNLPATISTELVNLSTNGNGEMLINLDKLMPINSTLNSSSNAEMKIVENGNPQANIINTESKINLFLQSQ